MEQVTNRPLMVEKVKYPRAQLEKYVLMATKKDFERIGNELVDLLNSIRKVCDKRFVTIKNAPVWLDREIAGIYPQWDKTGLKLYSCNSGKNIAAYSDAKCGDMEFKPVTESEGLRTFRRDNNTPYMNNSACLYINGTSYNAYYYDTITTGYCGNTLRRLYFNGTNGYENSCGSCSSSMFPLMAVFRLAGKDAKPMSYTQSIISLLCHSLIPEDLTKEQEDKYTKIMSLPYIEDLQVLLPYFEVHKKGISFRLEKLLLDYQYGKLKCEIDDINYNYQDNISDVIDGKKNGSSVLLFNDLLFSDQHRGNLTPYTNDQLADPNKGHWELFEKIEEKPEPAEGEEIVQVTQPIFARPPQLDVIQNGTVGIDFGTKSTVVACRRVEEKLLRVGKGNYTAAPVLTDYENPTVIELRDIDAFRNAYASRDGRPFTEWEQLTVSHQANNALYDKGVDSSVYYSVFGELKQWANDKQRRLLLRDRQGHTLELKPYLELAEGDFDPIEVYAYYLGLYINNMTNGIYLDYILSFPVNYGKEVREHLLVSFQKGLRKSLPPALLRDEEAMRSFRVYAGASEPAAYAICALKELQLEPQEPGQKVSYAVFDFGGGTTDFDFGTEEKPADKRRNFVVHQFGKGGDVYLGGENLLNLMAYEVYKANINEMREKSIPFVLPPDSGLFADSFAGSERLVYEPGKASQQAYMNRKLLAQLLRPIWERQEGYEKLFEQGGTDINLYSLADGKQELAPVKLTVNVKSLEELIEKRIRYGVQNFFQKMNRVFTKKERLEQLPIHILLAGNSCKSPVVRQLFEEAIKQMEQEGAKTLLEQYGTEANAGNLFRLHLPLGMQTGENASEQAPSGIELDRERTGKTGVVFGLLRSRKGGKDVRIVNEDVDETGEASFSWYLGNLDTEDKFHVVIGLGVGYGAWARFDYADEEDFEIYYTSDSQAPEGKLPASAVKMVRCRLDADEVDEAEEAAIYIRKIAPDAIEYATGRAEDFAKSETGRKVHKQTLR